jgi:hypothetical protein
LSRGPNRVRLDADDDPPLGAARAAYERLLKAFPAEVDKAVVEARLRAGDATATGWGAEVRRRLSVAMQNGRKFTAEEVAEAATAAVLGTVQSAGGDLVRNQFEQRIRHHYAGTMEGPEALEVLCASEGTPDQVRLKTQQQVRDCVNVLLAG